MRLSRHIKAYIQAEIRDYHKTIKELEELKDDLLNSSPFPPDGMPRASSVSNPTLQRASSLILDRRIKRLEAIIAGIESVLNGLDKDKLMMIELKYWHNGHLYNIDIANRISVDKKTVERWDRAICYSIALELGEVQSCS